MSQNQELVLAQMKESLQKLGYSTDKYEDPTLMRFLIARSFDKVKAADMFVQWLKWRDSFVPLGLIPDSQVKDELSAKKVYLLEGLSTKGNRVIVVKAHKHLPPKDHLQFKKDSFVPLGLIPDSQVKDELSAKKVYLLEGLSTKGNRVIVVKAHKHLPPKDHLQFKKFVVHLLDKVIASSFRGKEIGNEKYAAIIDLQQISYKNVDTRSLITGFQFLQAYYPERLAKLYFLHMPGFFVRVWRFASRFLDKATQTKIVIVSNADERREFINDIGEEALPEEYGGQAKLVLLQDFRIQP